VLNYKRLSAAADVLCSYDGAPVDGETPCKGCKQIAQEMLNAIDSHPLDHRIVRIGYRLAKRVWTFVDNLLYAEYEPPLKLKIIGWTLFIGFLYVFARWLLA
jgi:hypothetical protein